EDLLDRFTVNPIQDSTLISVGFQWREQKDCRTVLEDVTNEHLNEQLQNKTYKDSQRSQELNQLMNSLTFRQQGLQDELKRLQIDLNKEGINVGGHVQSPREIELAAFVKSMSETQDDMTQAQGMAESVNAKIQQGEVPPQVTM